MTSYQINFMFGACVLTMLTACGGSSVTGRTTGAGGTSSSQSGGSSSSGGAATSQTGAAGETVSISGSPAKTAQAGSVYTFVPAGSDNLGNKLTFSVSNAPSWASFDTATGQLQGTPSATEIGSYANIVITANCSSASASLPAFTINVTPPGTDAATLTWNSPLDNTDGSALTNLSGYYIYYGTSADALTTVVAVAGSENSFSINNLSPGNTYYFSVVAFNSQGLQSASSEVVTKTI